MILGLVDGWVAIVDHWRHDYVVSSAEYDAEPQVMRLVLTRHLVHDDAALFRVGLHLLQICSGSMMIR